MGRSPFDQTKEPPGEDAEKFFHEQIMPLLPRIRSLCQKLARSSEEARELEQQILIRSWLSGYKNYDANKGPLINYLYRIAQNHQRSLRRTERLRQQREVTLDDH